MDKKPPKILSRKIFFVTCTVINWLPVFSRPQAAYIIIDYLRYLQAKNELKIFGYVLMENHIHLLIETQNINKVVRKFKDSTSRNILDMLVKKRDSMMLQQLNYARRLYRFERDFQLWQKDPQPKQIREEAMVKKTIDRIHKNPVRRGYVDSVIDWRYSSARNYAGQEGMMEVSLFAPAEKKTDSPVLKPQTEASSVSDD